jgi:hypothetical protein
MRSIATGNREMANAVAAARHCLLTTHHSPLSLLSLCRMLCIYCTLQVWQFALSDAPSVGLSCAAALFAAEPVSHAVQYLRLQVWQFTLSDVAFKLNASGTGSLKKAPEVTCDKAKIVCVDIKLAPQ